METLLICDRQPFAAIQEFHANQQIKKTSLPLKRAKYCTYTKSFLQLLVNSKVEA
jgi:hypothetical protein